MECFKNARPDIRIPERFVNSGISPCEVEAMSSHRPCRPALGIEKALEEIRMGRGAVYDGQAADACISLSTTNRFHFEDAAPN